MNPRFALLELHEPVELDGDEPSPSSSPSAPADLAGEPDGAGLLIALAWCIPAGLLIWIGILSVL